MKLFCLVGLALKRETYGFLTGARQRSEIGYADLFIGAPEQPAAFSRALLVK